MRRLNVEGYTLFKCNRYIFNPHLGKYKYQIGLCIGRYKKEYKKKLKKTHYLESIFFLRLGDINEPRDNRNVPTVRDFAVLFTQMQHDP